MGIEVEYQRALFTVLDAAKVSLGVTGIYDVAPQPVDSGDASAFPYIVIGEIFPVQSDTQTTVGFQVTSRIHVFSRTGSKQECKTIQGRIFDLLHRTPMTVAGFNEFELLRSDSGCTADEDTKIHGVCEYFGMVEVFTPTPAGPAFDSGFSLGFS